MLRQACFHLCKSPFGTRLVLGAPRGYIHSVPYKLQSIFTQSINFINISLNSTNIQIAAQD